MAAFIGACIRPVLSGAEALDKNFSLKQKNIGVAIAAVALAALALGAAALVMHTQGTLMSTLAQIKATAVTAATATGALATKVAGFIKAHYHYFIAGGAAAVIIGLGIGAVAYDRRASEAKPKEEGSGET